MGSLIVDPALGWVHVQCPESPSSSLFEISRCYNFSLALKRKGSLGLTISIGSITKSMWGSCPRSLKCLPTVFKVSACEFWISVPIWICNTHYVHISSCNQSWNWKVDSLFGCMIGDCCFWIASWAHKVFQSWAHKSVSISGHINVAAAVSV